MPRIEFGITPVRGYRKWDARDGRLVGSTATRSGRFAPPPRLSARSAPARACSFPLGPGTATFPGEGCGLYVWSAPEFVERHCTLLSKRIECWGVAEGWGRNVEHEKAFARCTCARWPCRPCSPIDLKLLQAMAAAYEILLLLSAGDVRRAFPPLTTGVLS